MQRREDKAATTDDDATDDATGDNVTPMPTRSDPGTATRDDAAA